LLYCVNLDDAITELFKGKLTTDPDRHSGEGIFFTSRIMDQFSIWSDGKIFAHNNHFDTLLNARDIETLKSFEEGDGKKGSTIVMRLSNFSEKQIREVFDMYTSPDGGFTITKIPIKNTFENGRPVSRSQARRLYHRFEDFEEVQLDFDGVESMEQGFAHELFVVFPKFHPQVKLKTINANAEVQKMINHVLASNK